MKGWTFVLLFGLVSSLLIPSAQAQEKTDIEILLERHQEVLAAHLAADVDSWMAHEANIAISANQGVVGTSTAEERRIRRQSYLERANFDSYKDLKEPIVKASADGTLGWLIAEVEVVGWIANDDGRADVLWVPGANR